MPASREPAWVSALRNVIKTEHGFGWSIREHRGKVQLTRRFEDGSRSSVSLDLSWNASCQSGVLAAIGEIRQRMDVQGLSLTEAYGLVRSAPIAATGQIDWEEVVKQFLESRAGRRKTTMRDLRTRMGRALELLLANRPPKDGRSLMRSYAKKYFGSDCPAGGVGRKRQLLDVAALLRFAVTRAGASDRWQAPPADEIEALIGHADHQHEDSVPIKPDDLSALLDALKTADKPDLYLAVALVGLFGLRPAELAVLRVQEGRLYVGNIKRNIRTMKQSKPDRLALPLDLPGREGEGMAALEMFGSGRIQLPLAIRTQIAGISDHVENRSFKPVGDAFRQLLDRFPFWQSLVSSNPGLTPYSLRHGYAWRGHKSYARSIPVRDLAALMGHNPATHHRHYGKWTDESDLVRSVMSITGSDPV